MVRGTKVVPECGVARPLSQTMLKEGTTGNADAKTFVDDLQAKVVVDVIDKQRLIEAPDPLPCSK